MKESFNKKQLMLVILITALILILLFWLFPKISSEKVKEGLLAFGAWAAPLYVALFAILPGFFFPTPVLLLAAGAIWGLWRGVLYSFMGALINMTWMFFASRYVFKDKISHLVERKLSTKWQNRLRLPEQVKGKEAFLFLFILRITPFTPYGFTNYVSGLGSMKFSTYLAASILGFTPTILVYLNLGNQVLQADKSKLAWAVVFLLAMMVVCGLLTRYFYRTRIKEQELK